MNNFNTSYMVYVSSGAVGLYKHEQAALAQGRFVCKQSNYSSIFRFARNLALHHHLPLHNYAQRQAWGTMPWGL